MRFLTSAVTSLLLGASAASLDGLVYLSDINGAPDSAALSPGTSRLIFAQRLGLGQTQNVLDADDKTIEALNEFGGRPRKLFGQNGDRSRPKAFIMIEGVEDPKGGSILVSMLLRYYTDTAFFRHYGGYNIAELYNPCASWFRRKLRIDAVLPRTEHEESVL
jgi:hypothetical protein